MMILGALEESAKTIVLKPYVLIPMLIVTIFGYLINEVTISLLEGYLTDIILYGESLAQIDPIFYILGTYPIEVLLLIISGIIMLFVTTVAFVSIAKISNKKSFVESINSSVMEWKRNLGMVIFGVIVFFLFFVIFFGILYVLDWIDTITGGIIGPLIYLVLLWIIFIVLAIIFTVKLSFTLPAFAQGEKVRDAIQRSWEMTNTAFWNALAFVIILTVIAFLIYQIFYILTLSFLELEIVLISLGEIISMTFFALGISHYYYQR